MQNSWQYPIFFATGLAAGFVDSIAGGGGLITMPVLLNLGFSSVDTLATNKLQACFGSGSATWHYAQAGLFELHELWRGVAFTAIGATAGTLAVQLVDEHFLRRAIPFLLVGIALYTLLQPKFGIEARAPRWSRERFFPVAGLVLGFYDGFFGPGTGSFWAMAFVLGLGLDLSRATAATKVMNLTSNLCSLLAFLGRGELHWGAGLTMGMGQLVGARLGSRMVIRRGSRFIRPVFIAMALALTVRLLWR